MLFETIPHKRRLFDLYWTKLVKTFFIFYALSKMYTKILVMY
jgi:hypothetical protein